MVEELASTSSSVKRSSRIVVLDGERHPKRPKTAVEFQAGEDATQNDIDAPTCSDGRGPAPKPNTKKVRIRLPVFIHLSKISCFDRECLCI